MTSISEFAAVAQGAEDFTAEDLQMLAEDTSDLPYRQQSAISLVQRSSPELDPHNRKYHPNAVPGCYVVPHGNERIVYPGDTGFLLRPFGFEPSFVEFPADKNSRVRPIDHGSNQPPGAKFLFSDRDGVDKSGWRMPNGNRLVDALICHMMVDGQACIFRFTSTALARVGRDWSEQAEHTTGVGKYASAAGAPCGIWRMTSIIEHEGDRSWYGPRLTLVARLGELAGPTLAEWRNLMKLRRILKRDLEMRSRQLGSAPPLRLLPGTASPSASLDAPAPGDDGNVPPQTE
jgi:hypothetical protein